jgi:AbrB family looped-hinge helix DNA binding protein
MALVKVRSKYQITLPSEARKNIRVGEKVEVLSVGDEILIRKRVKETREEDLWGLGKELWKKVDALEYLNELRSELEPREHK